MIGWHSRRGPRAAAAAIVAALVASHAPWVGAQSASNSAAAQALFEEARKLMAAGNVAEACPKLEESQRLDPGTGTLLNLAKCYEQSDRLASAWNTYLEAAASAKEARNKPRESEARRRSEALRPRLSTLAITVGASAQGTPGLEITRDGEVVGPAQWSLPIPADAGEHVIEAKAPSHLTFRKTVVVARDAEALVVDIPELTKEAPPPTATAAPVTAPPPRAATHSDSGTRARTQRTLAIVAGGLGVVGVGLGTAFGIQSKTHHDEAEKYCDGSVCTDARGVSAGEDAYAAGTVSTVAMLVGVLGIAGGVTLWLTAPVEETAGTRVGLGPSGVRLEGAF